MLKFIAEKISNFRVDLASKNFLFFSSTAIFLLSIYLRSTIDIGCDTAFYIDIGEKFLAGGKYYYDFFESNFPISFWIYAIQYKISNLTQISPIIFSEIFVNLAALISIFCSAKILKKSLIYQNKAHYNLIIISFFLGFFLRGNVIQLGEFGTKSSFLLILFFPYLSFSLVEQTKLSKVNLLQKGVLMGLIPCFKPHYLLIILAIESFKFWQVKSIKFFIEFDKLIMILIGLIYLNSMLIFTPEFFEFVVPMWPKIYPSYDNFGVFVKNSLIRIISEISIYLFIFLAFAKKKISPQKISYEDKILIAAYIGFSLCIIVENIGTIDQIGCLIVITTTIFLKFFYDIISQKRIILSENKFIFLAVFLLPIFDMELMPKSFFSSDSFINLWWVLAFFYPFFIFFKKKIQLSISKNNDYKTVNFLDKFNFKIISLSNGNKIIISLLLYYFVFFLLTFIAFLLIKKNIYCFALFNLTVVFLLIFCYEKFINSAQNKFSSFTNFLVLASFSCCLYNYIFPISNLINNHYDIYPNEFDKAIYQINNEYSENSKDSFLTFSNFGCHSVKPLIYLKKPDYFVSLSANVSPQRGFLGAGKNFTISDDLNKIFTLDYLYSNIKKLVANKNVKFLAVNTDPRIFFEEEFCKIGYLEYYFKDPEFKKLFNENFKFESRLVTSVESNNFRIQSKSNKENYEDKFLKLPPSKEVIRYNFEFYVRK